MRWRKHGNRAMTSRSGSADVLEQQGVKIDLGPEGVKQCMEEAGIGFMFAPRFHPAMKFAVQPRREIGVRTVFNILGPLTNPAGAKAQVLGVPTDAVGEKMVRVLQRLGSERVLVVHAEDGLDEISLNGSSNIWELKDGEIKHYTVSAGDLGLDTASLESLAGGSVEKNAEIMTSVLSGEKGSPRDVVAANAAGGIVAGGKAGDLREGVRVAQESIDSGNAMKRLEEAERSRPGVGVAETGDMAKTGTILDKIVAVKREDLARAKAEMPRAEVEARALGQAAAKSLNRVLQGEGVSLIAEVKKASPSRGLLAPDFDPVALARNYAENGASAISVLTETPHFQGRLEFLAAIKDELGASCPPLLRKDFIFDEYQVWEARAWGQTRYCLSRRYWKKRK